MSNNSGESVYDKEIENCMKWSKFFLSLLLGPYRPTSVIETVLAITRNLLISFLDAVTVNMNTLLLATLRLLPLSLFPSLPPLDHLRSWLIWTVPPRAPFLPDFD